MRFNSLALVASAIVLGACGGGGEAGTTDSANAAAGANAAGGAAAGGAAAGTATAMPVTGAMHEVKMVLDGNSYRFVPANIEAKVGDGIRFTTESGQPHNFGFDPANIPDDVEAQIRANMPPGSTELESPYQNAPGESHTFSLAGVKPGEYPFHCQPHLALGMTGKITVK
jgi:plastocyanin